MKNLTLRYGLTQFTYWAASSGIASFATAYLLEKGVPSGVAGALLAAAGLCSCVTQPMLASIADRSEQFVLVKMLLCISALCSGCILVQLVPGLPAAWVAAAYTLGVWSSDAMVPLTNALSVAYDGAGYPINYGVSRSAGAIATAVSSLVLGRIIAGLGMTGMLLFLLLARLVSMASLIGYPHISKARSAEKKEAGECSALEFFSRYPLYCLSLLGIAFLGMFHAMTENYLIAVMNALGGDSSNVGTALFISALAAAPVIFFFDKIRSVAKDTFLLKFAGVSFLVKAACFYFAGSISAIYWLQLLQITSYAILCPTQVYYASAKVRPADMVKGQAFITAAYALGCSAGSFVGGQLLRFGVRQMLLGGIVMALLGAGILFATVSKDGKYRPVS